MLWLTDLFTTHIIEIYFFYGLGFLILGMSVALESGHASALPLARAIPWLAGFGLLHAAAAWFDLLLKIGEQRTGLPASAIAESIGIGLEFISFLWLLRFGCELVDLHLPPIRRRIPIIPLTLATYLIGIVLITIRLPLDSILWLKVVDVWTSYAGGFPAFIMTVRGLILQSRAFRSTRMPGLSREMTGAAIAFCWYAVFDSVFVPKIPYPPASLINSTWFLETVGIPIQLFRAANALFIALFFMRALRIFAGEDRRQLEEALATLRGLQESSQALNRELRDAAKEMSALYDQLRQRDEVHSYLLQRVVRAQEEERRRLARDLHDGVGQTLSGLAAGLAALESRCQAQDTSVHKQMENMKHYAMQSLDELHGVITDLRPSLLDDLGLVAALRWYARHYAETLPIAVNVEVQGQARRLPQEIEIVLFRIAQEALTNVVRHARANQATIRLAVENERVLLDVEDDGIGFDPKRVFAASGNHRPWGLLGMQERAALVGGSVQITSEVWKGTKVRVEIPLTPGQREQGTDARLVG